MLFSVVVLVWSSNWAVMKMGLSYVDPLTLVFHRFLLASLALSPLLLLLRARVPRGRRTLAHLFVLGIFNCLSVIFVLAGMRYETSGLTAVVAYTQPLFVLLLAVPLLKEEVNAQRLLGLGVGFSGLFLLSLGGGTPFLGPTHSLLFIALGAFSWAVATVYYKRFLSSVDPAVTNVLQLWIGAAVAAPLLLANGGFSFPLTREYLPLILFASLGAFGIGLTLWLVLLRDEEAIVLSFSGLVIPMFALLFGWLLLTEVGEPRFFLSAGLILAGVYLINRRGGGVRGRNEAAS